MRVEGDGHDGGEGGRHIAGDVGQGRQTDVGELAHLLGARGEQLHLEAVLGAVWVSYGPLSLVNSHPLHPPTSHHPPTPDSLPPS